MFTHFMLILVSALSAPAPTVVKNETVSITVPAANALPAVIAPSLEAQAVQPVLNPALPSFLPSVTSGLIAYPLSLDVAVAPTAGDILDKVQAFYAQTKQLTAKFRQSVTNATFGDTATSDGRVWIKKPGKMRWDYNGKPRQGKTTVRKSFLSDGAMLWLVEHDNKQVFRQDLEQNMLPVAVSFLYGKGDLKRDFNAVMETSKKYGTGTDLVLKLTPKKPSAQYKNLFLVVDPTNHRVKQSIIIDSNDNINEFRFYEPDLEKEVKDAWFVFNEKSVKGYQIVDSEKEAAKQK